MEPLRVLAAVPYATGRVPGQRYRIEQWASRLANSGIEVLFAPFFSAPALEVLHQRGHVVRKALAVLAGLRRRLAGRLSQGRFGLIYVYREVAPAAPAAVERRLLGNLPVVFDFDDAIYLPASSTANPWVRRLRSAERVAALCRRARRVLVGNSTLREFAGRWTDAVSVVPSTIDTEVYTCRARPPNAKPVVGWTGSSTTMPYLQALLPCLQRLRERHTFELRVIGANMASTPALDVTSIAWSAETEVDDLQPLDVGLMPLPDDEWARGKCGMKALQYMALAIPPVVSPVGVNREIVRDGVSGLHASSDSEWIEKVGLLLSNAGLRRRLGEAGRRVVETGYSVERWAPRIADLLREAAPCARDAHSP